MSIDHCRIVLVRTHYPGNLGSVARIMHNFGLSDLVLVNPLITPDHEEARRLAVHGGEILAGARIVGDLAEALADCSGVWSTSAQVGGLLRTHTFGSPRELMPDLYRTAQQGRAALVFGPEPSGLTNEEIARCHALIHIPTAAANAALNLSHAVAICVYELFLASQSLASEPPRTEPAASFADQDRMFEHLREGLTAIHFLFDERADYLMNAMRHLIGRAGPTPMELKWLHGLARQMLWVARQKELRPSRLELREAAESLSPAPKSESQPGSAPSGES